MKIRIGYGLGLQGLRPGDGAGQGASDDPRREADRFTGMVDALEGLGFDSLWLSERITGDRARPVVGLAFAAAARRKLKFGTSVQVLPGRNPVLLAKEWATLDRLSGGRALPAFGLGVADPNEQQAFGVERAERAAVVRRGPAAHSPAVDRGRRRPRRRAASTSRGSGCGPSRVQQPPDVWLGGRAPVGAAPRRSAGRRLAPVVRHPGRR